MTTKLERGLCPICDAPTISSTSSGNIHELFDPNPVRMLVVLSFPEIEGEKRVALGPCQNSPTPLHRPEEEAITYFGHLKHRCPPPSFDAGQASAAKAGERK